MTATSEPKAITKPKIDPVTLELPSLSRHAIDELYHFLQYLQFKHQIDLEPAIETLEDEIDVFDVEVALQEPGEAITLEDFKKELGWE
ncbi:MAG: hypothetical protein AAF716_14110 [Cyanobacteria bacterium P01_D01_bin.1]